MFSIARGMSGLGTLFNAHWRACAGAAFVVLALASIEYDEVLAPEMSRLSTTWSTLTGDFGRRISSFTL